MTTERDIQNQIAFARDKGMELGLEQGLEQGRAEGEALGMEKGAARRNIEIARAMLEDKVDVALIAKYSGLSAEEISRLCSK